MSPDAKMWLQVQPKDEGPAAVLSGNCVAVANQAVARTHCNQ
jgi:hypothetical protein